VKWLDLRITSSDEEKPRSQLLFRERGLDADVHRLEVQLQPKLNFARVVSRGDSAKVAGSKCVADVVPFGVVECVEELRAELEAAAARLAEHEALKQRKVPVLTAGTTQVIERRTAKGARSRSRESRGGEPGIYGMRIADASDAIRPVGAVGQRVANVAGGTTEKDVDRLSRCERSDSGYLPSADCRFQEAIGRILQERNIVDEVDEGDLCAIQTRGTIVISTL
jgi:hypothetical protein